MCSQLLWQRIITCFNVFTTAEQSGRQYPHCIIQIERTLAERHEMLSHCREGEVNELHDTGFIWL